MASVASSSRFCFLALKDGANAFGGTGEVVFEHECKINGISGIAPQLDAYIPNENMIPLSVFGINKSSSMFNLKQFLCHLSGIESQAGDSKILAYLFFKP